MTSMVLFPGKAAVSSATVLGTILAASVASAAPIVLEGDVPTGGPDHFFVEFDVPAGIEEIEIKHDDLSEANVLDFGVNDPAGYRGWGGGTSEPTIIAKTGASRAYVAGPIPPGKWRVVIGKAKVVASPAKYKLEIDLRATQTIASTESQRRPYQPPAARKKETRYYAGDVHAHSKESTDAKPTIQENIALAKKRGLDFIEQSDHNTITQLEFYGPIQDQEPDFLLLPGIEYTTYAGHANAIGATKWVEHKIGIDGNATIGAAADAVIAQGAILSINHPVIDVGDLCIGCAWKHDVDPAKIGGVEIGTLGLSNGGSLFSAQAIAFWDALLDKGSRAAAIGGSDDHSAGAKGSFLSSVLGSPTTLVRADELSVQAILDGIKKGRTVVKLDGPDDPMVELEASFAEDGEAVGHPGDDVGIRMVWMRAKVTGGIGSQVRFVSDGKPLDPVAIDKDPFVATQITAAEEGKPHRMRAEVLVDEKPRTVTSHIWTHYDADAPEVKVDTGEDDACSVASGRSRAAGTLVPIALAVLAITSSWARRRRSQARRHPSRRC